MTESEYEAAREVVANMLDLPEADAEQLVTEAAKMVIWLMRGTKKNPNTVSQSDGG